MFGIILVGQLVRLSSRDNQVTAYKHLEFGEVTGDRNVGVDGA